MVVAECFVEIDDGVVAAADDVAAVRNSVGSMVCDVVVAAAAEAAKLWAIVFVVASFHFCFLPRLQMCCWLKVFDYEGTRWSSSFVLHGKRARGTKAIVVCSFFLVKLKVTFVLIRTVK